ncbi:MAG: hypothetical protein WBA46_14710, partial [Thermomicrobiales bacterium]
MQESRPPSVTILGAGAWGTTLALIADRAGASVTLMPHRREDASRMATTRRHPRSLPGIVIPDAITIAQPDAVAQAPDLLVIA